MVASVSTPHQHARQTLSHRWHASSSPVGTWQLLHCKAQQWHCWQPPAQPLKRQQSGAAAFKLTSPSHTPRQGHIKVVAVIASPIPHVSSPFIPAIKAHWRLGRSAADRLRVRVRLPTTSSSHKGPTMRTLSAVSRPHHGARGYGLHHHPYAASRSLTDSFNRGSYLPGADASKATKAPAAAGSPSGSLTVGEADRRTGQPRHGVPDLPVEEAEDTAWEVPELEVVEVGSRAGVGRGIP